MRNTIFNKLLLTLVILFTHRLFALAQPKCYFEHYGTEEGLPQNTVMDILQDKKGIMWFSTWDGLCKFDGYKFTSYKNLPDNPYPMRSSRIDHIMEDLDGYIWTLSYDNEAHRFDPHTETFTGIRSLEGYDDFSFFCREMLLMPSGKVWLLSDKEGCISITDERFSIQLFNKENSRIKDNKVNFIYEDNHQNSWILTSKGAYLFSEEGTLIQQIGASSDSHPLAFHSATQVGQDIWLASEQGKVIIYNLLGKQFRTFQLDIASAIQEIKPITSSHLLITTASLDFFIYNTKNHQVENRKLTLPKKLQSSRIKKSYIDKSKRIWFELSTLGVSMYNFNDQSIQYFEPRIESPIVNITAPILIILEDQKGRTWVHPKGGGFSLYDPKTNKLLPFYNEPNSKSWQFSSMLHAAYIDKQDNLWLGTHSEGLDKVLFSEEVFHTEAIDRQASNIMSNRTRCIFEDNEKNLWVSTKEGKVHVYNSHHQHLGYLCDNGVIGQGKPLSGITYCIMQDTNNNIWLGTKGKGIYQLKKNTDRSFAITSFQHSPTDIYSLSSNSIYSIYQDYKNRIWIGSYGGGLNLMTEDGKFINHNNQLINYPSNYGSQIRVICEDKYGNICLGTTLGLIMFSPDFSLYNNIQFKFYIKQAGNALSLSANDVYDIITTKQGQTYFATFGGGVNTITSVDSKGFPTKFDAITKTQGLSSDIALQLIEDHEGKLWISSEGNISIFNPSTKSIKTYSEISKMIKGFSFTEGSSFVDHNGFIYFGYTNGLLTINPFIVHTNTFKPYLALTNLQISNKDVTYGKESPLHQHIDDTENLILNHKQNSFNIEFAAIDYANTRQIQYAYKLEGFDTDWISAQELRTATYNNLLPKKYTFQVKSTNSDGVWVDNIHTLPIHIVPSFWQTSWATLLYIIIAGIIISLIFRSLFIYYRLKDKINLEQEEIEMKTRFFMDISHEIRTPLTMIVSPIQNILDGEFTMTEIKNQLNLVLKNSNRMLRMVNLILDFRKIEKGKLNIQSTLFGKYVQSICQNFKRSAELNGIQLTIHNDAPDTTLWIDRDHVEKLIYNLLSNAIKHTPSGKRIDVSVTPVGNTLALEVKDEGSGMNQEIQKKLFTRFASFSLDKSKPSTGIGLSIVKEVADKHKARIEVNSKEDHGSTFTVYFPMGHAHFEEGAIELIQNTTSPSTKEVDIQPSPTQQDNTESESTQPDQSKPTILVVEDDYELRGYIVSVLNSEYNVIEAEDGQQGYDSASSQLPDFILSDIMMPRVDGVAFLQMVKGNRDTSHIPFILLTAKVDMDSRLQGLKYGADDYITKPFSVKYLKARIKNIISQRQLLYHSYFKEPIPEVCEPQDTADELEVITLEDKTFIKEVKQFIETNIDNSELVVEDLANEMLMSRTVFFKKMKSLTGLAPIEFVREVRIKYAAQVIKTTDYPIKEVAFMVGFSDAKYFTKWFKAIMGTTPSNYREENGSN